MPPLFHTRPLLFQATAACRNHYETLGVSKEADAKTIKQAFRQRSKETHPDTAGPLACPRKFQRVAEAANVLTNPLERARYDKTLERADWHKTISMSETGGWSAPRFGSYTDGIKAQSPFQRFILVAFRPSSMLLGCIVLYVCVKAGDAVYDRKAHLPQNQAKQEAESLVRAWKNPRTNQWEQPAPWDPLYRQLQPELELKPKHLVKARRQ
jgi:curved DNA-binding protein CbpA